jgi:hypothetical protein
MPSTAATSAVARTAARAGPWRHRLRRTAEHFMSPQSSTTATEAAGAGDIGSATITVGPVLASTEGPLTVQQVEHCTPQATVLPLASNCAASPSLHRPCVRSLRLRIRHAAGVPAGRARRPGARARGGDGRYLWRRDAQVAPDRAHAAAREPDFCGPTGELRRVPGGWLRGDRGAALWP